MLLPLLYFAIAKAERRPVAQPPPVCPTLIVNSSCANHQNAEIAAAVAACKIEWSTNHCDQFAANHPEAQKAGTIRDCNQVTACQLNVADRVNDYIGICLSSWGDSLHDEGLAMLKLFTGQVQPRDEDFAKFHFFETCTSTKCKRQMLGPFASYFTKEEIEGHSERTDLDPKDFVNQTVLHGYSAAVLYRKLLLKLKKESETHNLQQQFIPPWSDSPEALPLSIDELITKAFEKAGIKNTSCLKPEVVAHMRCYALFSLIDPIIAGGLAGQLVRMAGLAEGLEEDVALTSDAGNLASQATAKTHIGKAPKEPLKVKVAPYNPEGDIDTCVACTSAFLSNAFEKRMVETAKTIEMKYGVAGEERHFNLPQALSYIRKATASKSSVDPVAFVDANAPVGNYAIFFRDPQGNFFHVAAAWITSYGRKFIYDAQTGTALEIKTSADWKLMLEKYKAAGARPYQFTPE